MTRVVPQMKSDPLEWSSLEIVNAKRHLELIGLLSQPERFDFDAVETAWGGDKWLPRTA